DGELGGCPRSQVSPDGLIHKPCENVTMSVLAEQLSILAPNYVDLPPVDPTQLKEAYAFQIDWAGRPARGSVPAGPTIFEALERELGLRLLGRKLQLTVVVVVRVERTP